MANSVGQQRLAVLIDADNTQPALIQGLISEVSKYGTPSVKRIYGDWTKPNLRGWKDVLLGYAIQPIQQFAYTTGKNATDSAMIIDAMDLLYSDRFDAFCLVSSDSDFTRLASRIREAGLMVYGFGERKTPQALVTACDKFIYSDILRGRGSQDGGEPQHRPATDLRRDARLVSLLRDAVESEADDSGWAALGRVGSRIGNEMPEFDPRNYGYTKLGELVKATGMFDIDARPRAEGGGKTVYVKDNGVRAPQPSAAPAAKTPGAPPAAQQASASQHGRRHSSSRGRGFTPQRSPA
jgi:hypothetical protein